MTRRQKKKSPEKVGGFAFYLSLFSLIILAISNISALIRHLPELHPGPLGNAAILLGALVAGFIFTHFLVPERILVFMHETKHALVSGLAGNRWKEMDVTDDSGHFEYSYTKRSAHLNALISLAPYYLPLISIPATMIAFATLSSDHRLMVALIGFSLGVDLFSNVKDIDPRQSDFSSIRGGFAIALLYVIAANAFILSIAMAWGLDGLAGIKLLGLFFWRQIAAFVKLFHKI